MRTDQELKKLLERCLFLPTLQCYFYRQVKIIIKRIQNCPDILVDGEKTELNSRYDTIRIQ